MSEEILAKGRFRVDRKRALEKMERFQLADPLAYTVELLAAAVLAGATRVEVTNDSDDFVLRWDGDGPTRDELDGLFDHLFTGGDGRGAMLQHLAMGLLGALGQKPKWIHVDRAAMGDDPALRLTVADPTETRSTPHPHDERGTRIHVRDRLTFATLWEALRPGQAAESRLLAARARWCPVPVVLNGTPVPRPAPPDGALARHTLPNADLWLLDGAASLDIVRHGVVVGQVERPVGPMRVGGWMRGDTLELDASRANIVRDEVWKGFERQLEAGVAALLQGASDALSPENVRHAAVCLAAWGHPLGAYVDRPIFRDLSGGEWSPRAIREHAGRKGVVSDPALAVGGAVLFSAGDRVALDLLAPGLPDLSEWCRTLLAGQERRRRAEAERLPPEFPPSVQQRRFSDGPLRGAVRFEGGPSGGLRVSLRVGGLVVEETQLASPAGTMAAILDHPGFTVDDGFTHILPDDIRRGAEARLLTEATAFAVDHLERLARGAHLTPSGPAVLTAALRAAGAKSRTDLRALLASRPDDPLLRAPGLSTGDGRWRAVPDLLAGGWIIAHALPPDCPPGLAARVIPLSDELATTWLAWLGPHARDGRGTLADEIRGEQRRSGPRRPATLSTGGPKVPLVCDGARGEVGLAGGTGPARIELLRDGVPVGEMHEDLGLPGVVAVVDAPQIPVNAAHDALTDPTALKPILTALAAAIDALARAVWDAAPAAPGRPLSDAVLAWLASRAAALPDWAVDRPIVYGMDDTALTARALRERAAAKNSTRLKLLSAPPGELPGFEDAYVVPGAQRAALLAVGGRAVRDADPDVASARIALEQYLRRPAAADPRALDTRLEERTGPHHRLLLSGAAPSGKAGVVCRWVLPASPDQAGVLRLEARWRGRTLATWDRGQTLGLHGILEGPDIRPNAALSTLRDPNLLSAWSKHARTRFDDVLRSALEERFPDGHGAVDPQERAAWRALLARLEGATGRSTAEDALRARLSKLALFARLDGTHVSQEAVAAALSAGPVLRLPIDTPPGPTDTPWYLLDEPFTAAALGSLASRLGVGATALAAWREGEERRRSLARREARVTVDTLARATLPGPNLIGEIGLVRGDEAHTADILVHPLVDGRPLEPLRVPFPAPAVAYVTGPGVRADRAFRVWQDPDPKQIIVSAHELAATLKPGDGTSDEDLWLMRHAWGDETGASRAVFPLLGGGRASASALAARGRVGVVPISAGPRPFVAGPPPVRATPAVRALLATKVQVVELNAVWSRHREPEPLEAPAHALDVPGGRVGWAEQDGVAVIREGVRLITLPAGGLVPIAGWIDAPDADMDGAWIHLIEPSAAKVVARLRAAADRVVADLAARAEAGTLDAEGRAALLGAITRCLDKGRDERGLSKFGAEDPMVGTVLAAPIFRDAAGAPGAWSAVVSAPTVRVVDPGVTGRPLPARGRVWQLTPEERRLVQRLRNVTDATAALLAETEGAARRSSERRLPPRPGPGVTPVSLPAPFAGALWLGDLAAGGVQVRVDGAVVEHIATPVPGLAGWIEGSFETDDALRAARLDTPARDALRAAALDALRGEVAAAPERTFARLGAALAARSHDVGALTGDPLSPWAEVPLATDTDGAPVDLAGLVRLCKGRKRLLVSEVDVPPPRGERILRGDADTLARLRTWFPTVLVEHVHEAEARRAEKRLAEEARKQAGARGRHERAMTERAHRLLQRWSPGRVPQADVEEVVRGWAAGDRPGWPPFLETPLDGAWPALVAFAAGEARVDDPIADRLARVAGLAEALAAAGHGKS
jgi:hypothetical protein